MNYQNINRSFLILALILLFIGTSGCGKKKDNKGAINSPNAMGVNVIVIQPTVTGKCNFLKWNYSCQRSG